MSSDRDGVRRTDLMHPMVFRVVLALAALLIVSVWWGFSGPGYQGLTLMVVTLLVVVTVVLSSVLRHIARRRGGTGGAPGLKRWLGGVFVSNSGQEPARDAALELLLPILAVSVGMLVFAIVLRVAVPGA
jgi:hypothetical protein